MAQVIDAWEYASDRASHERQDELAAKAMHIPKVISRQELLRLRRAFEARYGRLEDRTAPSACLIETLSDMVTDRHQSVLCHTALTCEEEAGEERLQFGLDQISGTVKIKRGYGKIECGLPGGPESFRQRLRLWGRAFGYMAIKFQGLPWLATFELSQVESHIDFILGPLVYGLEGNTDTGSTVSPSWKLVLAYDTAIRKEVAKKINNGTSLEDALTNSRNDVVLRERHFTTPLAIASAKAFNQAATPQGQPVNIDLHADDGNKGYGKFQGDGWYNSKGAGKGKGKNRYQPYGKGGKKGGGGAPNSNFVDVFGSPAAPDHPHLLSKTTEPTPRPICFAYNSAVRKCAGECGLAHLCRICQAQHPAHMCTVRAKGQAWPQQAGGRHCVGKGRGKRN